MLDQVRRDTEVVVPEVMALEARKPKKISQMRDDILEELKNLRESRQAVLAYRTVSDSSL